MLAGIRFILLCAVWLLFSLLEPAKAAGPVGPEVIVVNPLAALRYGYGSGGARRYRRTVVRELSQGRQSEEQGHWPLRRIGRR